MPLLTKRVAGARRVIINDTQACWLGINSCSAVYNDAKRPRTTREKRHCARTVPSTPHRADSRIDTPIHVVGVRPGVRTQRAPHTPGEARPLPGPCSPSLARSTHERIFGTHGRSKARRVAARRRGKSRAGPRKQAAHPLDGRARDRQAEGRHAARGCLLGAHTALEAADALDERLELRHLLGVGWG